MAERADRSGHGRRVLGVIGAAEDVVHYLVALVILATGVVVLVHSAADFYLSEEHFAERTTAAINGVLLVVIVMEILRTVLAHFDDSGLQLKPFLIIGIISTVRHILTAGAELSLRGEASGEEFRSAEIMLGVNATVALALVIALVLIRNSERRPRATSATGSH